MKNLSTFSHFDRVEMSRDDLRGCFYEVITIMVQLRDREGMDEETAIVAAISEQLEGMDAIRELQLMGEDAAPQYKFSL